MKKSNVFDDLLPTPLEKCLSGLQSDPFKRQDIELWIKRDDLIHPLISGNKWRKLKYNLQSLLAQKKAGILTFGGAYSNHLYAVAAASKKFGIPAIGVVRGEKREPLNATLQFAQSCGMQLEFVSRTAYRDKQALAEQFSARYTDYYLLPEGGTNILALKGCKEIVGEIEMQWSGQLPDYLCASCGTGGTLAGLVEGMKGRKQLIGFSALKGDFHRNDIAALLRQNDTKHYSNWTTRTDYHFGGYARYNSKLIDFINDFKTNYGIALDPLYTGKMFYGLFELAKQGFFEKGSRVVALHSGGLQGILGFNERFGPLIHEMEG